MTIKTPETLRQLAFSKSVAEELSNLLADEDDDKFNVVAFELAKALIGRIEHAIDVLNCENDELNRADEEEDAIHSAAKRSRDAARAMRHSGPGYALEA